MKSKAYDFQCQTEERNKFNRLAVFMHQRRHGDQAFSMASLKRRAFNQHLVDRMCEHLANRQRLEKSSPDYKALCNYGIIVDEAA